MDTIKEEAQACQSCRNGKNAVINWGFTTKEARIKLKKLYPTILD
jgi:hypothetical protein